MPIIIPLILFGGGFFILDKVLSSVLQKEDVLYSIIDNIFSKITGKSTVLYMIVTFGTMIGSFYLANMLYSSSHVAGWIFGAIAFILLGYIASHRYR